MHVREMAEMISGKRQEGRKGLASMPQISVFSILRELLRDAKDRSIELSRGSDQKYFVRYGSIEMQSKYNMAQSTSSTP